MTYNIMVSTSAHEKVRNILEKLETYFYTELLLIFSRFKLVFTGRDFYLLFSLAVIKCKIISDHRNNKWSNSLYECYRKWVISSQEWKSGNKGKKWYFPPKSGNVDTYVLTFDEFHSLSHDLVCILWFAPSWPCFRFTHGWPRLVKWPSTTTTTWGAICRLPGTSKKYMNDLSETLRQVHLYRCCTHNHNLCSACSPRSLVQELLFCENNCWMESAQWVSSPGWSSRAILICKIPLCQYGWGIECPEFSLPGGKWQAFCFDWCAYGPVILQCNLILINIKKASSCEKIYNCYIKCSTLIKHKNCNMHI